MITEHVDNIETVLVEERVPSDLVTAEDFLKEHKVDLYLHMYVHIHVIKYCIYIHLYACTHIHLYVGKYIIF